MANEADYCESLVRESDKDRFLATLFAPADSRPDLFVLYAFDLETAAVPHRVRDPVAGEVRYQWWHDVLSGTSEAAGHPVAGALLPALSRHDIPVSLALAVVDARRRALYPDDRDSETEFALQAAQTDGAVYEMAAQMLRAGSSDAVRLASHHAGVASAAARSKDADRQALAERHLDAVKGLIPVLPPAALPALLPLALIAHQRSALPQWRKQWILLRASKNLVGWL